MKVREKLDLKADCTISLKHRMAVTDLFPIMAVLLAACSRPCEALVCHDTCEDLACRYLLVKWL